MARSFLCIEGFCVRTHMKSRLDLLDVSRGRIAFPNIPFLRERRIKSFEFCVDGPLCEASVRDLAFLVLIPLRVQL